MITKFCIDCKWCVVPVPAGRTFARCTSPQNTRRTEPDLVTGESALELTYCTSQRDSIRTTACGEEARWFEPKEAA